MMTAEDQSSGIRTLTLCPKCPKVLDAWLYRSGNDMRIRCTCPEHGPSDTLYYKDADLYEAVASLVDKRTICRDLDCARGIPCTKHIDQTYNIMIDLTRRCNMKCPVCFAAAEDFSAETEPSPREIFERLPVAKPRNKPNVVLIGGEPTLRTDLPEIIRGVSRAGYLPRLSTNGLRLTDENYARSLKEAGLRWVILQFDGLDDATYELMRGRPLLEEKRRIIENCGKAGLAVQLAVMVDEKRNGDQIGRIIELGFVTPAIKWINFYPRTEVNRDGFGNDEGLHVAAMMRLFEEQTQGRLTRADFLTFMRLLGGMYRLTGKQIFRQKISTYPMVLVREKSGIVPLPRLTSPADAIRHGEAVYKVMKSLPALADYQGMKWPDDILFMTMEKFHSREAIDLCEASTCHMSFMTRHGFVPFDIYNCLYRETANW